jgi:uroporphyrinogen-III synthase
VTATVLVTRPADSAGALLLRLHAAGLEPRLVPTVARQPMDPARGIRPALSRLAPDDWLVVTSATGADLAATEVLGLGRGRRPRIAVIGPATGQVLSDHGLSVAATASEPTAQALVAAMAAGGRLDGRHVLLARADAASRDLPDALTAAGAEVRAVATYRTVVGPASSRRPLRQALSDPATRAVLFASGSAVRGALVLAGPVAVRLEELRVVTIGPATTSVAREAGLVVAGEAARPDAAAQVAVLREVLAA